MGLQAEKMSLIEWITNLSDAGVIKKLKKVHDDYRSSKDWGHDISDVEKQSITKGLKDLDQEKTHSHQSAKSLYEKYL